MRNMGVPVGHSLLGIKSASRGLGKMNLNSKALNKVCAKRLLFAPSLSRLIAFSLSLSLSLSLSSHRYTDDASLDPHVCAHACGSCDGERAYTG
jgi:hypothetical protein